MRTLTLALLFTSCLASPLMSQTPGTRPRAREAGVIVGIFDPGPLDAITDVAGVRVGQTTVVSGDSVHTGVTAILPHPGDMFHDRVPAAMIVGNGFGKLIGYTQVRELGEIETPILLTCTLCVWKAADAMVAWLLKQPGMGDVRSINPVVGETNDGFLSDIRARPITPADVVHALESAAGGPVQEGAVGAGAGTVAFGWKGGIGTASRRLPESLGGYTVGVLVQTNFGGVLQINGAPVGLELGQYAFQQALQPRDSGGGAGMGVDGAAAGRAADAMRSDDRAVYGTGVPGSEADGSCMIVVATDAPLGARNLQRIARRALAGLARTGSSMTNGSGDYVIAFSAADSARIRSTRGARETGRLGNDSMSPLFEATIEATQEAIYNSLFKATTVHGYHGTIHALPLDSTLRILREHHALNWTTRRPAR